jgi:hypothetical protein
MNNELHKNAEGYTDPTAAATLNRKEPGDIWEYKGGECLIIKGHPGFATILRLHDSDKYGDRVKVTDRDDGPRYVDPAFIISGRYSEMGQYVETLDAVTFGRVIDTVAGTLGLPYLTEEPPREETPDAQEIQDLRKQLDTAQALILELEDQLDDYEGTVLGLERQLAAATSHINNGAVDKAQAEAAKARNQLELLREMYNELLAKAVGGGW